MQQRCFDFEQPASVESVRAAQATSLPPPLVRPDGQFTYGGVSHYEWPDATLLHDRDAITVDRITDDIDGPAHRFVIKRVDVVEVYLSPRNVHADEVIGISHANEKVRVALTSLKFLYHPL